MGGRTKDHERREARDHSQDLGVSAHARLAQQREQLIEQRRSFMANENAAVRDLRKAHESLMDSAKRAPGATRDQASDLDAKRLAEVEERQARSLQQDRDNKAADLARAAESIEDLRTAQ